jgi:KaiC/GvpD/RAD55 family RecA-like ATPase
MVEGFSKTITQSIAMPDVSRTTQSADDPFFDGALPSGIEPLDALLGALVPGRIHVICGTTGTAKSIAALQFVHAAIAERSTALLLTQDDASDIAAMGRYLGMRLGDAVRSGHLMILRCQAEFAKRYRQSAEPEAVFDELRSLVGWKLPTRIAIDSVSPFLEISATSSEPLGRLARWLEGTGATSLVTVPGDIARTDDLRVDALVQRAAAVVRLNSHSDRGRRMEALKTRFSGASRAPVEFRIEGGRGIVMRDDGIRLATRASA